MRYAAHPAVRSRRNMVDSRRFVYGDQPVQHLTFAGEPCDRLRTDGRELFKWERGDTRWILVARAGHPEAEKVVSTLLSTSVAPASGDERAGT